MVKGDGSMSLTSAKDACERLGVKEHKVRFTSTVALSDAAGSSVSATRDRIALMIRGALSDTDYKVAAQEEGDISVSQTVMIKVEQGEGEGDAAADDSIKDIMVSWGMQDDALGTSLLNLIENIGR